jgi:hypothetical protein
LPDRGNRRVAIPWLGGRRRLIHAACKPDVDAQTVIDLEPVSIGAAVLGHERPRAELARRRGSD